MLFPARSHPPHRDHPDLTLISKCKTPRDAAQLHARLITGGLLLNPTAAARIVLRLSSSPHPSLRLLARRILLSGPTPTDPFLWNALIKSSPSPILTLALMLAAGAPTDEFSLSLALKACARIPSLREGVQVHSLIQKSPFSSNIYLLNSLIALYSKCGLVETARQVFDRIPRRDSVSWNSMIDGYVKNGNLGSAVELFNRMGDGERNLVTWNSIIGGYASSVDRIDIARQVFDEMPERDLISWNLMVHGYARCGRLDKARELFEQMPVRDVVSWANLIAGYMELGDIGSARRLFDEMRERDVIAWNIMVTGCVKNGDLVGALCLVERMRKEGNVAPDGTTLASVLSAISELGHLRDGVAIHEYIERKRMPLDGKLGVALIDMYSKCGDLQNALQVFETSERSVDHCNAMIGGLAIHGFGESALLLFREMERLLLKPDDITFIGVLSACSHSGMVEEGLMCFETMQRDYKLEPKVQHYGCMVDILGRAGLVEKAWKLIESMPVEPNDIVWRSLLSACRNVGRLELGQKVARNLIEGHICRSSSYILLSNLYAGLGMWRDVSEVRMFMKERDMKKAPGCSWIELDGVVHEFVVGDNSHPQAKEIYSVLDELFTLHSSSTKLSQGVNQSLEQC